MMLYHTVSYSVCTQVHLTYHILASLWFCVISAVISSTDTLDTVKGSRDL